MNSKKYVLEHDFGYGQECEQEQLNKLQLRNCEDLIIYLDDILNIQFAANIKNNVIYFNDNTIMKMKIEIL